MVSAIRLCKLVTVLGLTGIAAHAAAQVTTPTASLAPQLCRQLGGPLACQPAQPGPWTYKVGDAIFKSEAKAYEHMLDTYGTSSVFALAYRWGETNPDLSTPERDRTIETMNWKMYYRECSGHADGPCQEFPRYTGYQRIREVACPAGYRFSSDASSPFCLPEEAARAFVQASANASRIVATDSARPALRR